MALVGTDIGWEGQHISSPDSIGFLPFQVVKKNSSLLQKFGPSVSEKEEKKTFLLLLLLFLRPQFLPMAPNTNEFSHKKRAEGKKGETHHEEEEEKEEEEF